MTAQCSSGVTTTHYRWSGINSSAAVIYDFDGGSCNSGCTTLTGVLTLSDAYIPGSGISESSDVGAVFFISFEMNLDSMLDSTIGSSDFAITAGLPELFYSMQPAADEGNLPSIVGLSAAADVTVGDRSGVVGINDYFDPGTWGASGNTFWFCRW